MNIQLASCSISRRNFVVDEVKEPLPAPQSAKVQILVYGVI